MKGNPKKRRRGGKPPVHGKQLELSGCLAQNEEAQVGASVGSFSEVVVKDASIGAWSDADDEDSCFGACLATDRDYDGPVNCSMAGSGDVPIVDCVFLQHEQMQSSSHNGDAMECESESTDGMDYDGKDLVDTELEGEDEDENVEVDSDDDDDSSGSNYFTFVLSDDCCNNCRRRKFARAGPEQYQIRLRSCRVQKSSFRRKFANVLIHCTNDFVELDVTTSLDDSQQLVRALVVLFRGFHATNGLPGSLRALDARDVRCQVGNSFIHGDVNAVGTITICCGGLRALMVDVGAQEQLADLCGSHV